MTERDSQTQATGISAVVAARLATLLDGAEKTFDNAEQLFCEAHALASIGARARALSLHQFSLEECSKVDSLGVWATSLVLDLAIDEKKLLKALALHKAKNKLNAYMLEVAGEELAARERGDWDASMVAFRDTQESFHRSSNDAKNHSLYVDWNGDSFMSPAERISAEMLAEIAARNETFLDHARNHLQTLRGLVEGPEKRRELMLAFVKNAEALQAENPPDRMAKMHVLLERFQEDGLAALGTQRASREKPA